MTQHAKLPWRKNPRVVGFISSSDYGSEIACTYGRTSEERDANQELIVRACNTHERLVAALEQARHGYIDGSPTAIIIEDALALARGEEVAP